MAGRKPPLDDELRKLRGALAGKHYAVNATARSIERAIEAHEQAVAALIEAEAAFTKARQRSIREARAATHDRAAS